jgi:arabinofuranan 3-O-arabinosyltransferase
MERRPLLAGFLLGLLSYKPQIGIVFPLVLAVSGQWRVFWAAAVTALGLAAVSWLTFGSETWQAFGANLAKTNELVLGNGLAGFQKLQSVFGVVRWYGGDETLAWIAQGTMAAACTVAVSLLWRRQLAYEIKAAALATAALLATPYIYVYDLAALAVPMAFLIRIGLREGFQPGEAAGLALAAGLVLAFLVVSIPSGFCAVLLVGCLVGARAPLVELADLIRCANRPPGAVEKSGSSHAHYPDRGRPQNDDEQHRQEEHDHRDRQLGRQSGGLLLGFRHAHVAIFL